MKKYQWYYIDERERFKLIFEIYSESFTFALRSFRGRLRFKSMKEHEYTFLLKIQPVTILTRPRPFARSETALDHFYLYGIWYNGSYPMTLRDFKIGDHVRLELKRGFIGFEISEATFETVLSKCREILELTN